MSILCEGAKSRCFLINAWPDLISLMVEKSHLSHFSCPFSAEIEKAVAVDTEVGGDIMKICLFLIDGNE